MFKPGKFKKYFLPQVQIYLMQDPVLPCLIEKIINGQKPGFLVKPQQRFKPDFKDGLWALVDVDISKLLLVQCRKN